MLLKRKAFNLPEPLAERLRDTAYLERTTETEQLVRALDKHLPPAAQPKEQTA